MKCHHVAVACRGLGVVEWKADEELRRVGGRLYPAGIFPRFLLSRDVQRSEQSVVEAAASVNICATKRDMREHGYSDLCGDGFAALYCATKLFLR